MIAAPTRPILRYHGGKWILAPWIISHFPEHTVYVDTKERDGVFASIGMVEGYEVAMKKIAELRVEAERA